VSPSIRRKCLTARFSGVLRGRARSDAVKRSGPGYRHAIPIRDFYADEEQKRIAQAYIDQLGKAKVFPRPVVTQIVPLQKFYPAEDYHQDYAARHPNDPYIMFNDL
jgi:peptide-methionine (S)-S-oxide reductase